MSRTTVAGPAGNHHPSAATPAGSSFAGKRTSIADQPKRAARRESSRFTPSHAPCRLGEIARNATGLRLPPEIHRRAIALAVFAGFGAENIYNRLQVAGLGIGQAAFSRFIGEAHRAAGFADLSPEMRRAEAVARFVQDIAASGGRFAHRQTEQFARFVHAIESSPTEDLPPPPIAEARLTLSISRLASPPVANLATVLGSWGRFSAAEIWGALDLDCQGVSPRSFSRHCRRARGARLIRQFTLEDLARMVATWLRFEGGEPFLTAVLARVRDLAGIEQPKDVVKQ